MDSVLRWIVTPRLVHGMNFSLYLDNTLEVPSITSFWICAAPVAQPENFDQFFLRNFLKGNQSRKRIQQSAACWRRSTSNICWLTGPHGSQKKSWLPAGLEWSLDRLILGRKSSSTTNCYMAAWEIVHWKFSNSYTFAVQKWLDRFTLKIWG